MKTHRSIQRFEPKPRRAKPPARRSERGVSLLIILALLAGMAIIVAANSTAVALLKQELKLIDQRQLRKYGQGLGH